ncbi:MAG: C39 family peptidase [Methanolobus sp.]
MSGSGDPENIRRNSFALHAKITAAIVCILILLTVNIALTGGSAEDNRIERERLLREGTLLEVPYYNQGDTNWCLYYCMAMMYNYNNHSLEAWEIADYFDSGHTETFSEQYNPYNSMLSDYTEDTFSLELRKTIWGYNIVTFNNETFNSMIMENIERGQPVLMAFQYEVDGGYKEGHAIIAVGYDSEYIYLTDPSGAITTQLFDCHDDCIAVPVPWEEFNEKLVSRIEPSNMAFTLEILDQGPEESSQGSLYLVDRSNSNYSSLSFTNRNNFDDVGLLRLDGDYEDGYTIVEKDDITTERAITSQDSMSVYFTIANPTAYSRNYVVKTNFVNKDTDSVIDSFFFEINTDVHAYSYVSKGINYSNQLSSLKPGTYAIEVELLDENNTIIDTISVNINVT